MDCAVIPLSRHKDICLVQTVDFFYPLVDSPITMGEIALANVLSDIYAVGVTEIDKLIMIISAPEMLSEQEWEIICPLIVKGFQNLAKLADIKLEIQNIVLNPWCIIGGTATSVVKLDDIIMPSNATAGDVLILTKPLGTQLATNAFTWMQDKNEKYKKLIEHYTDADVTTAFQMAVKSMTYLNRNAALLMHKFNAHAATDITGFGLVGHAKNLVDNQHSKVTFKINTIPIIKNILNFAKVLDMATKLSTGKSVETSGGLLICLPAENGEEFCNEFRSLTNEKQFAWIIGEVLHSDKHDVILADDLKYIEAEL